MLPKHPSPLRNVCIFSCLSTELPSLGAGFKASSLKQHQQAKAVWTPSG